MLPNYWYGIYEARKLKRKPVGIERLWMNLVVWRDEEGKPVCLEDKCSHRGAKLSMGKIKDGCIRCPYHGFTFDKQGACTSMPCDPLHHYPDNAFRVRSFPIVEYAGVIWMWYGDKEPDTFWLPEIIKNKSRYSSTITVPWSAHFTRVVENALDLIHLAVAHYPFLWLLGEEADELEVRNEGDVIINRACFPKWGMKNKVELSVKFPNVFFGAFLVPWLSGFASITPINDQNSYMIFANDVRIPFIGGLVSRIILILERTFLGTVDKKIVEAAEPRIGTRANNIFVKDEAALAFWYKRYEDELAQSISARIPLSISSRT